MRVFIDGYGSIGKRHHTILKQIQGEVDVDINDPNLNYFSKPSGRYDIGVICTPTSMHLDSAIRLRQHCNLLFIEKPLHTSLAEIIRASSLLKDENIHVGCNIRYTDAVKRLFQIRNEAKLIRVTSMSNLLQWRNDPKKESYSFHKSLGGGVLMDFIHEPDYIYSIFGPPTEVDSFQMRLCDDVTIDSDDTCVMNWKYQNLLISFVLSYCSSEYIRTADILKSDLSSEKIVLTKSDIEGSYKRQWESIILNGPQNTYNHCMSLYERML